MFSDVSLLEHKNVPVVKEEVKTTDFSPYEDVNEKENLMEEEIERISPVNKVG